MSSHLARHRAALGLRSRRRLTLVLSIVGAAAFAVVPASADVLSFTYSDLDGDFDAGTSTFTAVSRSTSDGDVTRLVDPVATATLDFGNGGIGMGLFGLSMLVINPTDAAPLGLGGIILQDTNGDHFDALIGGTWYKQGSSANFVGEILSLSETVASGTPVFNGTSGSLNMNLPTPLTGNIITLSYGGWFSSGGQVVGFNDKTTLISGAVTTPEPASLALLLAGGVALARRRH